MVSEATAWTVLGAWTAVLALHHLLSGRTWLWALPEMIPPIAFVAVPLIAAALAFNAPSVALRHWGSALALVLLGAGRPWNGLTLPLSRRKNHSRGNDGRGNDSRHNDSRHNDSRHNDSSAAGSAPVVIFVWNTKFWDQDKDPESFYRFLRAQDADVYLLQEYAYWAGRVVPATGVERLSAVLPDHVVFTDGGLLTIVHRRLVPRREPGVPRTALRTDICVGPVPIALYNIHLPEPLDIGRSPFTWDFYQFVRAQAGNRQRAFHEVEELLDKAPAGLFMGGDFNSSPAMRPMRRLHRRYVDVMRAAGHPYLATWPANLRRLWRIDWLLASPQVTVEWARLVDPSGLSDHAGQLCAIRPAAYPSPASTGKGN